MPELELEPLERLDLRKCTTVGSIVLAMNQCSFGARMLGEVALKMRRWIQQRSKMRVVYDGQPWCGLLESMRSRGWVHDIVRSNALPSLEAAGFEHLVVGRYSESADDTIHRLNAAIMINKEELSRPGQVRDGFFPDAVFADPTFILPVLYTTLSEWIDGRPVSVDELFRELVKYPAGQRIVEGAHTLHQMIADPECMVFLTLSGAMTIAKMGLVICDMVDL